MIRVKNQKIIRKLSNRSLKANRVRNVVAVFAIALTTLLFTALFTIVGTMMYSYEQQTFRQVGGSFHGGFKNLTREEMEILKKDPLIQEAGGRLMLGSASGENFRKVQAEVSYMDESYLKRSFCMPEYGKEPKEGTKELACDTRVLDCLGVEQKIGAEVTLTYQIGGVDKEEITDTFLLSGWWEYDAANRVSTVILPESYVEQVLKEHPTDMEDASNASGKWSLNIFLGSSLHIEEDMEQILENHGYQAEDPSKENYIGIGVNWGYTAAQMSANDDAGTVAGTVLMACLIVLTGYLIIYNIFQISISGDIRFYGLLKTIGTTGRQIRRMIRRQAMLLFVRGIPVGLLLGYFSGVILAPLMISSMNKSKTYYVFNPWIFIGAVLFSLITVLLSCAKPGRIAAKVSPVEAVRYTDVPSGKKQRKKSRAKTDVFRMAQANLGRNKKKTFLVVLSLSLAVVLLQTAYTLAIGFDMEKYLDKWAVSDFVLGDVAYFQCKFYSSENAVQEQDILAMDEGGEITESGRIYGGFGDAVEYVAEDLTGVKLYGMEDYPLSWLQVIDGDLNDLYDPGKNAIAAVYKADDCGNAIESSQWAKAGDTVKIRYVYEWEYVDVETGEIISEEEAELHEKEITAKEKEYRDVSYEVAACVMVPNAMSYRYYGNHEFVLNAEVYQRDNRKSDVMSYMFNTAEEDHDAMQQFLEEYTKNLNPVLDFESKQTYIKEFSGLRDMFLIVGGCLSFVIGLIGVLNFFNAILTSIYARRREFAMLQSIGMTGRQLKQMLIWEGLLYGILAVAVSVVLSFLAGAVMDNALGSMLWFFTYRFTLRPVLFVIPIFAVLGIFLPLASYKNVARQTIVERLRMGE